MLKSLSAVLLVALSASSVKAQTRATQAEIELWSRDGQLLDTSPCKKITYLLETTENKSTVLTKQPVRYGLAWWGRGFIEGALSMLPGDKAAKAADDGLSLEVIADHITTYCYAHQDKKAFDAIGDLLLKILKTAK